MYNVICKLKTEISITSKGIYCDDSYIALYYDISQDASVTFKMFALFITEAYKRHAYIFFQLVELSCRGDVAIYK